ncbi:helix-turn-helix domain-containing protein [Flavobacterium sp. LC2016-23]|uniref:helix-turn-helix domain-containing protein n=1 Tax=Flavobacterium sp. LC2016-23 TaxID=2666330 RepID=UPI0012AF03D6|nr:helix-turn-helix transcriptional regulator [Flavobacterium sp. LC2016-23]MRX41531.1 helix-turn-helix domain-containing protein [Flavobacterium sp. LC2016-23]
MHQEIQNIKSISQLHEVFGFEKPTHPMISIIDVSKWEIPEKYVGVKYTSELYTVGLKDKSCGLQYGRNHYDFDEGVLLFTAPGQVQSVSKTQHLDEIKGWMLFFHPDLIRNVALGRSIDEYGFFAYDVYEALHLSDTEQKTITDCKTMIQNEISERIDNHSQTVIASSLELLLNLSRRYYERQFNTRSAQNSDVVSQFHTLLNSYYKSGKFAETGIPSVEYFSGKIHLSGNYLSDLLKKETGYALKDHVNNFIVEKAKTLLLIENETISGIAYNLGFNYPHYFSRLFKSKTGLTPQEYKLLN